MQLSAIARTRADNAEMMPLQIPASWIISGTPQTHGALVSRSPDGAMWTEIWDCTAGSFDWHYDLFETVHIIEGGAIIVDADGTVWDVKPGDVLTFRRNTSARWTVPTYIRKVAFLYRPLPLTGRIPKSVWDRLRNLKARLVRR